MVPSWPSSKAALANCWTMSPFPSNGADFPTISPGATGAVVLLPVAGGWSRARRALSSPAGGGPCLAMAVVTREEHPPTRHAAIAACPRSSIGRRFTVFSSGARVSEAGYVEQPWLRERGEIDGETCQPGRRAGCRRPSPRIVEAFLRMIHIVQDQEEHPALLRLENTDRFGSCAVRRIREQDIPVTDALQDDEMMVAADIDQNDGGQSNLSSLVRGARNPPEVSPCRAR